METVKILHCADIHIGAAESFLGAAAKQRRYETLMTFERIIDCAVRNGVQLVAIAGDLFDSNAVEPELTEPVFAKIAAVPQIKVVFAAGNHDPLSADSPFRNRSLPDNLFVLNTQDDCISFDDIPVRVYGSSFEGVYKRGETRFSLTPPDDDRIDLMVLHGELTSDPNSNYNAVTQAFLESSGMDYIALGHMHARTEITRLGRTFFAYCGCPEGQGFDETGEKGVYLGEIGKGSCALRFVPLAKRMHLCEEIDVTGISSNTALYEKILAVLKEKYGEGYAEQLYKIRLTGSLPEEFRLSLPELAARLSDALYFVKLRDETELQADFEVLAGEISLKGLFVKNMLAKIEAASDEEKETLQNALKLGLKAFSQEVFYRAD